MSRGGDITLPWGDGEYTFQLTIGDLRKLQEVCGEGPPVIRNRLRYDQWKIDDVTETLRLGLIRGGKTVEEARKLMARFVGTDTTRAEQGAIADNVITAYRVISEALFGSAQEKVGKGRGSRKRATGSQTEKSPSQDSTALAR
jgi:stalled ribosome alternative rescue factor ArfA